MSDKKNYNIKRAFTLAEVLITLTIIGVIAALTIPNLMQAWRKHERITQIKTAYSIIQNAVKMSVAENGNPDGWSYDGSADLAQTYILPFLKIQHVCGQNNWGYHPLREDCFESDENGGFWYYFNGQSAAGSQAGYGAGTYFKVKLQNGMDFGIWGAVKKNQQTYGHKVIFFVIDVNGSKGNTKLGDDVYAFAMDTQEGMVRTPGLGCGSVSSECIGNQTDISTLLTSNNALACTENANRLSGYSCSRVLELNHWEFPENYPIKKF